jgi:hypothetical protein
VASLQLSHLCRLLRVRRLLKGGVGTAQARLGARKMVGMRLQPMPRHCRIQQLPRGMRGLLVLGLLLLLRRLGLRRRLLTPAPLLLALLLALALLLLLLHLPLALCTALHAQCALHRVELPLAPLQLTRQRVV